MPFPPNKFFPAQLCSKVLYYLVTDSAHLRKEAIRELGDKVVVTGAGESVAPCESKKAIPTFSRLGIEHIHQRSGHADGVFNAVLEEARTESAPKPDQQT